MSDDNEATAAEVQLNRQQIHTLRERLHLVERRLHDMETEQYLGATRTDVISDEMAAIREQLALILKDLEESTR